MLNLDINLLPSYSLKTITISDDSDYSNYRVQNEILEVTPPNASKIAVAFKYGQINTYKAVALGLDCTEFTNLPDGLWVFKYSIHPNTNNFIEKSFYRTELLRCKFGKFLLSLHMENDCPKANISEAVTLKILIDGITSAANNCNYQLAEELYKKADNILTNKKDCLCQ